MNYSIYNADRTTHLKIVVVALAASIAMAGFGIATHFKARDQYAATAHVFKPDKSHMRLAIASPARQDTLSALTFVNSSAAPTGIQTR